MTALYPADLAVARAIIDRSFVDRLLVANGYLVLGTADADGQPWVTPVFYAPLEPDRVCWVSSPDSRHSRNITSRAALAITFFDPPSRWGERRVCSSALTPPSWLRTRRTRRCSLSTRTCRRLSV